MKTTSNNTSTELSPPSPIIITNGGTTSAADETTMTARATTTSSEIHSLDSDIRLRRRCQEAVSRLKDLKINFLALDFDLTIIDRHTGGKWINTPFDLATHVRPIFRHVIPLAISHGLAVAVTTFSSQVELIATVLRQVFPEDVAGRIPVEGGMGDRATVLEFGKQRHIAKAIHRIEANLPLVNISPESTLLVDDDQNNINVAKRFGCGAVWFNPDNPVELLDDVGALQIQ
mmetsp:Transcript_37932/g.46337  ORF Transcript_37932/g.46337 Transcript_37932/m.46337 type:complete len:231 (-) Transcript_37932:87-779(-)